MEGQNLKKLLKQVEKSGSQSDFRVFYDAAYDYFFRIAYYYLQNEESAQEIVLDAFMRLWERRGKLSEISSVESYCFTLVKNLSLSRLEKEKRHATMSINVAYPEMESASDTPEEILVGEELFERYVKALNQLPVRCREVFLRVREDGLSYAQTANELNISIKTVNSQMQRATNFLKKSLF